jgi:hypothetical protein
MLSEDRQQEVRDLFDSGKEISEIYTTEEYEDLVEEMLDMLNLQDDPEVIYPEYQVYIAPQGVKTEAWNKFVKQADELFQQMFKTDNAWEDR